MALTPLDRLLGLPFFSEADYLALNPDVGAAGLAAGDHALRHGMAEDRPLFRPERLAQAWGRAVLATGEAPAPAPPSLRGRAEPDAPVSVLVSSWSDPADLLLAASIVEALAAAGMPAGLADETSDPDPGAGCRIVVSPHVFFASGLGTLWADRGTVERCLLLNTLSPHHAAFPRALPYLLRARGLLDVSPQTAHLLGRSGAPTLHLRVAAAPRRRWLEEGDVDHPLVRALPPAGRNAGFDPEAWETRPLDIAFLATNTARRSRTLQRNAALLARHPSFVYVAQPGRDALDDSVARRHHVRIAGHVSGQARLTLLIAEDGFPAFDWLRCIASAMASGSVVVSDNTSPHPDYAVGVHYFQDDARHLGELCRWLVEEPDGREAALAARARAFDVLGRSATALAADLRAFLASLPPAAS